MSETTTEPEAAPVDLEDPALYYNRELSWIEQLLGNVGRGGLLPQDEPTPGQRPGHWVLARYSAVFSGKIPLSRIYHQVFPRKVPDNQLVLEQFTSGAPHKFHNIRPRDHSVQI